MTEFAIPIGERFPHYLHVFASIGRRGKLVDRSDPYTLFLACHARAMNAGVPIHPG